jgi:hypothetical protein
MALPLPMQTAVISHQGGSIMNQKVIAGALTFIALVAASPCFAGGQDMQTAPDVEEIKTRVAEAKPKGHRLTVKLTRDASLKLGRKPGASVSGKVMAITGEGFEIRDHSPLNGDTVATIRYSEVASVKRQSGVGKVFKNIGEYSLLAAMGTVAVPVLIVSSLIGHPIYTC